HQVRDLYCFQRPGAPVLRIVEDERHSYHRQDPYPKARIQRAQWNKVPAKMAAKAWAAEHGQERRASSVVYELPEGLRGRTIWKCLDGKTRNSTSYALSTASTWRGRPTARGG